MVAEFSRTDVLRHVDARTIGAEEEFFVQTIGSEVSPYRTVGTAVEDPLFQTFFHLFLTFEVSVAFVVNLVERHTEGFVGFVKTGIHPFVHLAPESAHFGVALLPFAEHFARFHHQRCFFLGACFSLFAVHALFKELGFEGGHFGAIMLVESHVVVADEVVAFLTRRLGCFAVAILLPSEHRFANVDTAVVHDVGLHHPIAVGFGNLCHRPTEEVVTDVTEVERLVGVGRGVFDHHQRALLRGGGEAVVSIGVDAVEEFNPLLRSDDEV